MSCGRQMERDECQDIIEAIRAGVGAEYCAAMDESTARVRAMIEGMTDSEHADWIMYGIIPNSE